MSIAGKARLRYFDRLFPPPQWWTGEDALYRRRRVRARVGVRRWLLPCLLCCLCTLPATSSAQIWQDKISTHLRVFYQQNPAFAAAVREYAEVYYYQIRLDPGLTHVVQRDQIPRLWDKYYQIYLYPNRQAYRQATGAPVWSSGFVNYPRRPDARFSSAIFNAPWLGMHDIP